MKYLLFFMFIMVCALTVFAFFQYKKIDELETSLKVMEQKLPRFGEAAQELEQRLMRLEVEKNFNDGLKGSTTPAAPTGTYPQIPNTKTSVQQTVTNEPQPQAQQTTPTFKDMQKKH